MQAILMFFGSWLVSSLIAKLFKTAFSLGMAFVSYQFITSKVDSLINNALGEINSLPADFFALLNISRLDECISIIISGLIFLAMIKALGVKTVSSVS